MSSLTQVFPGAVSASNSRQLNPAASQDTQDYKKRYFLKIL